MIQIKSYIDEQAEAVILSWRACIEARDSYLDTQGPTRLRRRP